MVVNEPGTKVPGKQNETYDLPTPELIRKAWARNNDGAGMAWRVDEGKNAKVRWLKGMSLQDVLDRIETTPRPYILHFRAASCGPAIPELTHPFPVQKDVPLSLEGETEGVVFFHNGTWNAYDDRAIEETIHNNRQTPDGPWSDSRVIAWLSAFHGKSFAQFFDKTQRGVLFGPHSTEFLTGQGWSFIDGVDCSNDHFTSTTKTYGKTWSRTLCRSKLCTNTIVGNDEYCYSCKKEKEAPVATKVVETTTVEKSADKEAATEVASPFSQPIPLNTVLLLYQRGAIPSKKMVKKFRKAYQELENPDEKRQANAKKLLNKYSATVREHPNFKNRFRHALPGRTV